MPVPLRSDSDASQVRRIRKRGEEDFEGKAERRKQDALYVRIGGDGHVCLPPTITSEEIDQEKERLSGRFDTTLRQSGYIAMSGQIVNASLIAAPRQRNTNEEKAAIKAGRVPDNWKDKPAKLRQKDQDARWTVKFAEAKPREDGSDTASRQSSRNFQTCMQICAS